MHPKPNNLSQVIVIEKSIVFAEQQQNLEYAGNTTEMIESKLCSGT